MASKIEGTTITMTRGDTFRAHVTMTMGDAKYTPVSGDSVRIAVKHDIMNSKRTAYKDSEPLIDKQIPIDTMVLELSPSDTKNLEFGNYVYDIEITFADGTVDTFINNAILIIDPEVD